MSLPMVAKMEDFCVIPTVCHGILKMGDSYVIPKSADGILANKRTICLSEFTQASKSFFYLRKVGDSLAIFISRIVRASRRDKSPRLMGAEGSHFI